MALELREKMRVTRVKHAELKPPTTQIKSLISGLVTRNMLNNEEY